MIKLYKDKYVIEIKDEDPRQGIQCMKLAILEALEHLFVLDDLHGFDTFQLNNIMKLLREMEYEVEDVKAPIQQQ